MVEIKDRVARGDNKYLIQDLNDGTGRKALIHSPDEVIEAGTPVNKALLQPLFDGLDKLDEVNQVVNQGKQEIQEATNTSVARIEAAQPVQLANNLTTTVSGKGLDAAQGPIIAEQLKKSGLKIVSATFSSNQIRVTGDFEAQADVPFLLDLTTTSLSFDSNTNIRIGSSVLALKDFTGSALESIANVGQRQFLCVKKSNYIAIELFQSKLEKRTNEAFTSAHEGKRKLADALVSKGQVIDNQASFQEMASKIREIRVGKYNVGDWIEEENLKFYKYNNYSNRIITSDTPHSNIKHGCFIKLKGEICYLILSKMQNDISYGNPINLRVSVGYEKLTYSHINGTLSNNNGHSLRSFSGKTLVTIPVAEKGKDWEVINLEVTDENIYLTFLGINQKYNYVLMIVTDWSGNIFCKKEFNIPQLNYYHTFHQEKVFAFYSSENSTAHYFYFNGSDIIHKRTLNTTMSSGEFMFFLSPYGYYTAKTESGSHENTRRVIRFYDGSSAKEVGSVYGRSLEYNNSSSYLSSYVNSYFHRFYFKIFGTRSYNEGVMFYELDYKNHTIKIIDSTSRTSSSSEYFIKNCRFFPSGYIYDGYADNVIIYLPPDKSNTSHRQHSMRAQFSGVKIDKNCELVMIDDEKVFFMHDPRSDGIGYGYMRCNWSGVEVKK